MAKLSEIINKIIGLDNDKEYEFKILEQKVAEDSSTVELRRQIEDLQKKLDSKQETVSEIQKNKPEEEAEKYVTVEAYNKVLGEISSLKEVNKALLEKTPITPINTFEESLLAIAGIRKEG